MEIAEISQDPTQWLCLKWMHSCKKYHLEGLTNFEISVQVSRVGNAPQTHFMYVGISRLVYRFDLFDLSTWYKVWDWGSLWEPGEELTVGTEFLHYQKLHSNCQVCTNQVECHHSIPCFTVVHVSGERPSQWTHDLTMLLASQSLDYCMFDKTHKNLYLTCAPYYDP